VIIERTGSTFELKFLPLKNPFFGPLTKKFYFALLLVCIYLTIRALCSTSYFKLMQLTLEELKKQTF